MATLGDLRQYCVDHARQGASTKAVTVYLRLINDAIRDVRSRHDWSRFNKVDQVPLVLAVAGTDVTIASGGTTLTFGSGEVALQKYVDQDWKIRLAGDTYLPLRIRQVSDPSTAELAVGQEWVGDAVSSGSYTWYRDTYDLTWPAAKIHSVTVHNFSRELNYLPRYEFDRLRIRSITDTGDPTACALEGNKLLIWPAPAAGDTRRVLVVSYVSAPQAFVKTDPDDEELDWEEERLDLLHAAIDYKLAMRYPGSTRVAMETALGHYLERLATYMNQDGAEHRQQRTMTLNTGAEFADYHRKRRFHGYVDPPS